MTPEQRLDAIIANGFDLSTLYAGLYVRVHCSQCEALVINGVPCHESRCPNEPTECRECGNLVPKGETCCGYDDEPFEDEFPQGEQEF